MEKESLASPVVDCMHDLIKYSALVQIESVPILCCQLCLLHRIIPALLCDETVFDVGFPILSDLRHIWPIPLEGLSRDHEKLIDEIKAIILNIIICWIGTDVGVLKLISQVITNVRPVCVPKQDRI
jgi:hypothetical protein